MPSSGSITRRVFLRGSLASSLAALAELRALPATAAPPHAQALPATAAAPHTQAGEGRFFSPEEREILTQIVERMVDTGEPDAPQVRETRTIDTLDALVLEMDPALSGPLPLALRLFDWGPWIFDWSFCRFTLMDDAAKDRSIEAWMTSRLGVRRLAFVALRNLAFLGYYSQDETWKLIGYRGPLLSSARAPGRRS